jgi:multidrug efflux pump subunit AcrB
MTPSAAKVGSTDDQSASVDTAFSQTSPVPLSAVARIEQHSAPLVVAHQGLFPATTISFNLARNASLVQAVEALHQLERSIGMPNSVTTNLAGTCPNTSLASALRPTLFYFRSSRLSHDCMEAGSASRTLQIA